MTLNRFRIIVIFSKTLIPSLPQEVMMIQVKLAQLIQSKSATRFAVTTLITRNACLMEETAVWSSSRESYVKSVSVSLEVR